MCVCVCVNIYVYIHIYVCVNICVYIHIYMYIHIHMYMYLHTYMYIYTCVYVYTHIHIYMYIYTYIHTHIHFSHLSTPQVQRRINESAKPCLKDNVDLGTNSWRNIKGKIFLHAVFISHCEIFYFHQPRETLMISWGQYKTEVCREHINQRIYCSSFSEYNQHLC